MNFFDAKSVEELKKYGKLSDIREMISNILGDDIKVKANTWENLYSSILNLKKLSQYIPTSGDICKSSSKDLYFRGDAEKFIFILLELDGKIRLDKLGINKMHYSRKDIADKWRNEISKVIHPDICMHPQASDAMAELNEMYKEMIK